jgi:leucyl aminopeptidase
MKFSIKTGNLEKLRTDCLILGVFEDGKLLGNAKAVDLLVDKAISNIIKHGDMDGKVGATLLLQQLPNLQAKRVLLVGLGKEETFSEKQLRLATKAVVKAMPKGAKEACFANMDLSIKNADSKQKVAQLVEVVLDSLYLVNAFKQKKPEAAKWTETLIWVEKSEQDLAEQGVKAGEAIGKGVALTKDLGNLPPNICTPTYLGEQAKKMAKEYGFKVEVLNKSEIEKLGMGSFLGVSQGSVEPPRLIVMQHLKGPKNQKPVVLVGKGITFDTGGISLKPGADMDEMKYDMCGAASVFGAFKAIGELNLPLNVVAVVPTCENMPSGNAIKPGDILTSMSGLTIEVLNTDAEGRLILCDALTYAERFEPSAVVDIATLTGACIIALGHHPSAVYSNQDALATELLRAGEQSHDRVWQMPLWEEYQSQLDSNFADMANIGGRAAGSITAACFLSRFAKKYDWAHLDIAGTAWKSGKEKGGTGRPVPLLTTFLMNRVS